LAGINLPEGRYAVMRTPDRTDEVQRRQGKSSDYLIQPFTTRRTVASIDFRIGEEIVACRGELIDSPPDAPAWFEASTPLHIRSGGDRTDSNTQ
jgi:hypothetical protein